MSNKSVVDKFGNYFSLEIQDSNCLITKYSKSGQTLWQISHADFLQGLATDAYGNLYVAGSADRWGIFSYPFKKTYATVIKYNPLGMQIWKRKYKGTNAGVQSIDITTNNELILSGTFRDSLTIEQNVFTSDMSYFLAKITSAGFVVWVSADTSYHLHLAPHVEWGASNDIYMAYQGKDGERGISRFDNTGSILSKKTINAWCNGLCVDDSSNVYASHTWWSGTSSGFITLSKYSPGLNDVWMNTVGIFQSGPYYMQTRPVIGPDRNVYVAGKIRGGASQTLTIGTDTLTCAGNDDIIVEKINGLSGAFMKAYHTGGKGNDFAVDLSLDNLGNIYVIGFYRDTLCFDKFCLTWKPSDYSYKGYAAKLKLTNKEFTDEVGMPENSAEMPIVYPNSCSELLIVKFKNVIEGDYVEFLNLSGDVMFRKNVNQIFNELSLSAYAVGVYVLKIKHGRNVHIKKIAVVR